MTSLKSATKKYIALFLVLTLVLLPTWAAAGAPPVRASAYVLMEASTGRVLSSSNSSEKLPMASTTKIMTCLLAVENGNLDDVIKVPAQAVGLEGTSIYLRKDETVTLKDLVYGLMLASGNDAAVAIAIHISGSVEEFAKLMNQRAIEMGAKNTNFVTPNGLPNDNHYTTAYDLGLIAAHAMRNESFREVVGTRSMDIPADEDSPARYLRSKNKLLYQFEGGNGVKTGFTKAAGKCFVGGARRDNMQLISVVLNDGDMWVDSMALLNYGFETYKNVKIASAGDSYGTIPVQNGVENLVGLELEEDIYLPLSEDEYKIVECKIRAESEIFAPVKQGEIVGSAEFWLNGKLMASANLITTKEVSENTWFYNLQKISRAWLRSG